ncbi:IS1341-type transposase ISNamo21 [Natronomonas moolapensis 8.8.11]|uniref:IS1341-type transposase ISNamo21 n=1 Tax=Natronomonas moolapensis (strain DSM 18674 / CECT 7526 / JCM 14361 / 8.8.11) TaxID=268739 RepID=M1XPP7_NATM8|nr:IS200/IS605 family transposase [Natronomonas moolapensis]CCQ36042.1 IS1341-type transposase ISNamo21 [Natronomonas moolapensis 8.8.11]
MKRVNEFEIRPRTPEQREALLELLDASAALWNELTYNRRQAFFDDNSVWNATNPSDRYKNVLGSATAQQIPRKNSEAWRSFFSLNEKYYSGKRDEKPSPPGYWGNEEDGRELRTYIRNDQYTLQWGDRSRLEIPVGKALKDEYAITGRLRLEACGDPKWDGEQGRLELVYDKTCDTFRALQPVTVPDSRRDSRKIEDFPEVENAQRFRNSPLASHEAALDVGANNLVACTTTTGQQYLYEGRELFAHFRDTTEEIAHYQSMLDNQRRTSKRIDSLYRQRTERRNHAQDALVRDLIERLHDEGVCRVYVGDLEDVLETHWKCVVNEKTHNFWAFSQFIDRLKCVCEEYGIEVVEKSEALTTQECPECGEREETHRNGDVFRCGACGFEGHADLKASRVFLDREAGGEVGPMARPVRLEWDNHEWRPATTAPPLRRANPKEDRTDRSTCREVGKVASVGSS